MGINATRREGHLQTIRSQYLQTVSMSNGHRWDRWYEGSTLAFQLYQFQQLRLTALRIDNDHTGGSRRFRNLHLFAERAASSALNRNHDSSVFLCLLRIAAVHGRRCDDLNLSKRCMQWPKAGWVAPDRPFS